MVNIYGQDGIMHYNLLQVSFHGGNDGVRLIFSCILSSQSPKD